MTVAWRLLKSMNSWTGRSIVYETDFEREIELAGVSHKRLDEAFEGVGWAMSNKPYGFHRVPGSNLRMAKTVKTPTIPGLILWFTFDDTTVKVIAGELVKDDED